jgi:hypothetical protein
MYAYLYGFICICNTYYACLFTEWWYGTHSEFLKSSALAHTKEGKAIPVTGCEEP